MLLLICALTPGLLGGAMPLLRIRNRKIRMAYAFLTACLTTCLTGYLILSGYRDKVELFRLSSDFQCAFSLDGAGKVYLAVAAVLWPPAVLYATEYMRHEEREGHFFSWYLLSYSAAILLAASENLFTLYISYELLTLCTVPLVWHKQDEESTRSALVYMLYLFGGAALGFVAMILLPRFGGGSGLFALHGTPGLAAQTRLDPAVRWIALLGFLGFGVKAAVLPLCRWLPKASVAPTPVTALLHAVAVVNAGVFAILRVLYYTVPEKAIRGSVFQTAMLALSALTILYGAVMATREQHLKRRLAWSTVSNLSYMLFGLSLLSPEGMEAGLAHMVFHGSMKIILFFCAGAVMTQTSRTQAAQMRGLGRKMPVAFLCFALAGTSLLGVPPLCGFVSKYALVAAAFHEQGMFALIGAAAILIAAVLTAVYIFTVVYPAFFMQFRPLPGEAQPCDPGLAMKLTLIFLSALLIAASLFAGRIMAYLSSLAGGVAG